jgi:hypothetical protein
MLFLLHIPKMMMNVVATSKPMVECSTCLFFLFFSITLLVLLFSTISLPPRAFVCVHSFILFFPLLLSIVSQLQYLHSCYYELQNFENAHNFQQQMQIAFDDYLNFFHP